MGKLHELYDRYRSLVAFFVVYIKEAHPEDGWVLSSNRGQGIAVTDPVSDGERSQVATICSLQLHIRMPVLLDVDDGVARAYGAWPDRLYLIGRDGRVAWQGGPGPFGFKPDELDAAIRNELGH
ncbi:MAG: deiodinase [Chloroflexi bacterium]|nr:MAG: deiodinase [Chloroflexota bacterium]